MIWHPPCLRCRGADVGCALLLRPVGGDCVWLPLLAWLRRCLYCPLRPCACAGASAGERVCCLSFWTACPCSARCYVSDVGLGLVYFPRGCDRLRPLLSAHIVLSRWRCLWVRSYSVQLVRTAAGCLWRGRRGPGELGPAIGWCMRAGAFHVRTWACHLFCGCPHFPGH